MCAGTALPNYSAEIQTYHTILFGHSQIEKALGGGGITIFAIDSEISHTYFFSDILSFNGN